jgi:hypothetical protein
MTLLQLDSGAQPHSGPNAASRVPQEKYVISMTYGDGIFRSSADLPGRRQKLPG